MIYKVSQYNKIYLNSYKPLCINKLGEQAIKRHKLEPFVDASCRREPDFESEYPSITAICRGSGFAPYLRKDDIVVYMTVKRILDGGSGYVNKLVGFLKVVDVLESHLGASQWYANRSLRLPSNCLVLGNESLSFDQTAGNFESFKQEADFLMKSADEQANIGRLRVRAWDRAYKKRAEKWPIFVITEKIRLNLNTPPSLTKVDFQRIFSNKVVNTRFLTEISFSELQQLANIAGFSII